MSASDNRKILSISAALSSRVHMLFFRWRERTPVTHPGRAWRGRKASERPPSFPWAVQCLRCPEFAVSAPLRSALLATRLTHCCTSSLNRIMTEKSKAAANSNAAAASSSASTSQCGLVSSSSSSSPSVTSKVRRVFRGFDGVSDSVWGPSTFFGIKI